MMERIRYRLLMWRLRREIAAVVNGGNRTARRTAEKMKTTPVTACKACGSIV